MVLKMCEGGDCVFDVTLAEAINYAAGFTKNGEDTWDSADILNFSRGWNPNSTTVTNAFNDARTKGRGGRGMAIFVSSGNGHDGGRYEEYEAGPFDAGDWTFRWRYKESGEDPFFVHTAWLGNIHFPDDSTERFDSSGLPSGWATSGDADWSVVDDPSHAYGTGRYIAESGDIDPGEYTDLTSPEISIGESGNYLTFWAWIDEEPKLGSIEVWASNDGGENWSKYATCVLDYGAGSPVMGSISYPASLASTIALGASTDSDYRSHFSQYGTELDLVAPSGGGYGAIVTTDRTGTDGYNSGDYVYGFSGTSAAAPLAAGTAALLLAEDPKLASEQIRAIMRNTADKIGGVTYEDGFSEYYGYGRVNAAAGVSWVSSRLKGDLNCDGFVGQTDLDIVLDMWGRSGGEITDPRADVNADHFVGQTDLDYVLDDWGKSGGKGRRRKGIWRSDRRDRRSG